LLRGLAGTGDAKIQQVFGLPKKMKEKNITPSKVLL
jgi:hypothetical protein